ncbi:MAG: alpha/beta hydrolase fold domain-containing protein [Lachnospiraceae bacterium]|nr:alpha/beta hydrolase fold domain-containing protein [Lachnospiraceae bacterium]
MGRHRENTYSKLNMDELKELILKKRKKYTEKIPAGISKEISKFCQVEELALEGGKCYRIHPDKNFEGKYIFYLYGGMMCQNISAQQWEFIASISKSLGIGVLVPMYPLAPEFSCRETFDMLEKTYSNLTMSYDIKKLILMGDSSGAGLALSLAMIAWREGYRKPDQLILLSPVLDTEFFDTELEKKLLDTEYYDETIFYNKAAKDFINTYWVKDYAVKTEYTSPFYEDYTDLCDDVIIFSGIDDMFNCYARAFYKKAKMQGVNIRFFEFDKEGHNFIISSKTGKAKSARSYLVDVLNNTYLNSLPDIYPIKMMADWTKKYPDIINDEWATKFIYDNKFDFSNIKTRMSEYRSILKASAYSACDAKVARYIMEYPNCTIINLGCRLDNMFKRLDNGRIQWYSIDTHNIMSVRRSMYGEREREKTVGRDIMDFTWVDEIKCRRNHGVMFVCNEALMCLTKHQLKELLKILREKFPGADLVFTATTTGASIYTNIMYGSNAVEIDKKKIFVNDAQRLLGEWGSDYRLISEEPLMKFAGKPEKLNLKTKASMAYNKISYNYKIVHVRLGGEAYEISI